MGDGTTIKYYYKHKLVANGRAFPLDLLYKVTGNDTIKYYCLGYKGDDPEKYKGKWLQSSDYSCEYSLISNDVKSISESEAFELIFTKP